MKYLSNRDNIVISSFDFTNIDTFFYFDSSVSQSKIDVEICVHDITADVLLYTYNFNFTEFNNTNFVKINPASTLHPMGSLDINTSKVLEYFGYIRGNYRVSYKFYLNVLGTSENRVFIRKISSSRKEIIVDYIDKKHIPTYRSFTKDNFNRFSQKYEFNKFLNFGDNRVLLLLNSKNQTDSSGEGLILKLYEPLSPKIVVKDTLWITSNLMDEIEDIVSIDFQVKIDPITNANMLKAPNYLKVFENIGTDFTSYKKYADLVDTSSLGERLFSEYNKLYSFEGINLDLKYQNFENFIHFGSATQLLENFRNKLINLESYINRSMTGSTDGSAHSSSIYYKNKELEVIGGFTRYEKFLYYNSGSYFTSSLYPDVSIDSTWPKSATGSVSNRYVLYEETSSVVDSWYATMSHIAFEYDYANTNALIKTLPEYILNDLTNNSNNSEYITFVNMLGELFDNIWHYIVAVQRTLKRENKFEDGVPGEIIWNILRNYGLNLNSGQSVVDLDRYKYAYDYSGSTAIALERTEQTITQEIWNRILNNYPYIFKSKGTEKSIRALFNCYGIPNSLIEIQEFGGPHTSSVDENILTKYTFTYEDFTHVLQMTGSQYILVDWATSSYDNMKPDSIEFKMRAPISARTMDILCLTGSSAAMTLQLEKTVGEFGKFVLTVGTEVISSSVKPYFNNEFYSVLIKRSLENAAADAPQNYYLKIKNHDDYIHKITIDEESILSTSASAINNIFNNSTELYLGGHISSSQKFYGAFDEFRLWAEPLSEQTFDFHTKYSLATNGNTLTSSLSTLAFRLSFNNAYDLNSTASLLNEAFDTSSYSPTASAFGFQAEAYYPYQFSDYERSNTVEQSFIAGDVQNNKIRIEKNSITQLIETGSIVIAPLKGNYVIQDMQIKGQVGEFDNAPPDLDTLLIGFTPVSFMNRDIIAFYGNNDILSAYGDFNNIYKDSYPKNNWIIDTYWRNTTGAVDFIEYLKYIRTYSRNLFDVVSDLIPAKANTILGTVYEQNLLRRNRVRLMYPEQAINYNQHLLHIDQREYYNDNVIINDLLVEGALPISIKDILTTVYDDLCALMKKPFKFSPLAFDEIIATNIVYELNERGLIAYNNMYINRQRNTSERNRRFHMGTKNSSLTTYDRGPAVVITSSSPTKLVVNYADNPKLLVK